MRPIFYRRVWRFNALVIAALGVGAILVAVLAAGTVVLTLLVDFQRDAGRRIGFERDAARTEAASDDLPRFTEHERVAGTPYLAITVGAKRTDGSYGMSKSVRSRDDDDRNLLLLDLRDGTSRYVLPNNARRLVQWHVLSSDGADGKTVGRAYVALVGDSGSTKYDILIGNFATGSQVWAMRGVSAMDVPDMVDEATLGFIAWDGTKPSYHLYGVGDLKESAARPIPMLPIAKAR